MTEKTAAELGVKVKPIEWTTAELCPSAFTLIGTYIVEKESDGEWILWLPEGGGDVYFESKEAAKAAGEQHYERAILPAIESTDALEARRQALDEAAVLIEANSIQHLGSGGQTMRPRRDGDRSGLAYADAIRALKG